MPGKMVEGEVGDEERSTRSYKAPPAYEEGRCYEDWKLDIELWQEFTGLPKKKHGAAFLLELREGKVKNTVRSLGKAVISAENGLTKIIEELDRIYEENSDQMSYRAYCRFVKYQRTDNMNLQSYISQYEKLLADLKKIKVVLPEVVLAYHVLHSANLPLEKVDLALSTVKTMTYRDMVTTISKIFSVGNNLTAQAETGSMTIKTEPEECNYASHRNNRGRGFFRPQRGTYRDRGYHPYNRGNRTRSQSGCYVCGDKRHFAKNCPEKREARPQYFVQGQGESSQSSSVMNSMDVEEKPNKAYLTLLVSQNETPAECLMNGQPDLGPLVHETLACAVIDSGCTKTVVGRNWVNYYYDTLDDKQKKLMITEKCSTPFKFGDGKEIMSKEKVKIPGRIGKNNILIESNIVECELPLLMSKPSLKKAGAVIDFQNDKMLFNGESVELFETKSGHYAIPICNKRQLVSDGDD